MVETRFDRGVYEDDEPEEEDSGGGGGGGSSSTSSDGGGGGNDDLNLTENEKDADIVIRDDEIVAADEDANVDSSTPTQTIDSGGGGGGSSDKSQQESEMDRLERISKEGFSEQDTKEAGEVEGPERTAVESSITVEDQRTEVDVSSGGSVSRADLRQRKAETEETKINLKNEKEFLEEQGRQTQAAKLEDDIENAREAEQTLEQNIFNIGRIEKQQEAERKRRRQRQKEITQEKPVTGRDGFFTQLDAETSNLQQDSIADFQDTFQTDTETLAQTRPAQFAGKGLAGLESLADEAFDTFDVDRDFQSRTDAALFDTRTGRSTSTLDDGRPVTGDLEFDRFNFSDAPQVTDERVDELAEVPAGSLALATTTARDFETTSDLAVSTAARPFTQAASSGVDTLTQEDQGSDKVSEFDLAEGTAAFGAATVNQAKEDPTKFLASLGTDTVTGTAALRGTRQAGRAASNAPDAALSAAKKADPATGIGRTPRPGENTPTSLDIASDKLDTFEDFVKGDLEEQVRSTEGKEFIQTTEGVKRRGQQTNTIRFNTREGEDGVVIDPETQDAIETRDVSRTEFLRDQVKGFEKRFIEPNAAGLGPGGLVPRQKTRPDTDIDNRRPRDLVDDDTSTDVTSPQDRLQDVQDGFKDFADDIGISRRTDQRIFNRQKSASDTFVGIVQAQESQQTPFNEQSLGLEPVQSLEQPQAFKQETPQSFDDFARTESPEPFRREDEEQVFEDPFRPRERPQRSSSKATSLEFTNENEETRNEVLEGFVSDKAFEFDSSLGAELTGKTADARPSDFATQDPFNLRPVLDDSGSDSGDTSPF